MNTNNSMHFFSISLPSVPMLLCLFCFICSIIFHPASSSPSSSSSSDDATKLQQLLCARFPGLEACQPDDEVTRGMLTKRKSAYMRFGRAPNAAADEYEMEKRKSAYMRFGKRTPAEEGTPYQMLALNELEDQQPQMEKRKSAYMRFGKRKSAYMRFGRK